MGEGRGQAPGGGIRGRLGVGEGGGRSGGGGRGDEAPPPNTSSRPCLSPTAGTSWRRDTNCHQQVLTYLESPGNPVFSNWLNERLTSFFNCGAVLY